MTVRFLSGFSGSNGTLIVGLEEAWLFTDGRYFIQAQEELRDSGIILMKMGEPGVPTVYEHLEKILNKEDVFGIDGECINYEMGDRIYQICQDKDCFLDSKCTIIDSLWKDRPLKSCNKISIQKESFSGLLVKKKIKDLRKTLKENDCDAIFLSRLDEIMWLFNIRGRDVECNPVALSYAYIDKASAYLFVQKKAATKKLKDYASDNGFKILYYENTYSLLSNMISKKEIKKPGCILIDKSQTSITYGNLLIELAKNHKFLTSPIVYMKSVKNKTEQQQLRDYFLKDSAALVRFLCWFDNSLDKGTFFNENELSEKLQKYRRDIDGYIEDSFSAIVAYGSNAAMAHYDPGDSVPARVNNKGLLLIDSGGQYKGATTDSTRTIVCGELTSKEKLCFTLVLKGFLRLMNAKFIEGCTGHNLDILARGPLWDAGLDYRHGTGHGVGYCLNVHEGPQGIRWRLAPNEKDCVLKAGMLVTDEPGFYLEGEFGIRTENTLLIIKDDKTEYGQFLSFENLIFAPIDRRAIDTELLNADEIDMLNEYHKAVYTKVSPFLKNKEKKWLEKMCKPL